MEFTLDREWCKGLGTELCVLSTLLDYGVHQLNINKQLNNKNFELYKKIFNIPDNVLTINHTDILQDEISPSDLFKVFSPYYTIPRPSKSRQYIGLACYHNGTVLDNPGLEYPECKFYSSEEYSKLYTFLKKLGWEVITLDSRDISLEDKVYLITNFCECVIGYEGGIAHLCHMLDVPYIMFPWRKPFDVKLLHIDKKTYFLDSFDQILRWSAEDLDKCISNLNNSISNNELINNKNFILTRLSSHPISHREKIFLNEKSNSNT